MFTGIIEEVGTIASIKKGANSAVLTIQAHTILDDVKLGDSIAVNGVCLTVTALTPSAFSADVMHETLNRSSLGKLHNGSTVNLERAMAANGRFGGHIVSGHIDGTGIISKIEQDDNAIWYTVQADASLLRYIIEKGSHCHRRHQPDCSQSFCQGFQRVHHSPHCCQHHSGHKAQRRRGQSGKRLHRQICGKVVEPAGSANQYKHKEQHYHGLIGPSWLSGGISYDNI